MVGGTGDIIRGVHRSWRFTDATKLLRRRWFVL